MARGSGTDTTCIHESGARIPPRSAVCEECGSGFNLRVCNECGHVGCCESQFGHNTAHFRASGHPVIQSMPVDDSSFTWCYECNRYL
jgi:uncharacterized UBP type Zn finger protein